MFARFEQRQRTRLILALLFLATVVDLFALEAGLSVKLFFGYLSAAITVAGYALYLSAMYPPPNRTPVKPHPLSWLLFGALTLTGAIVQVFQRAHAGSWCLLITGGACLLIAAWSYFKWKGEWHFDLFQKLVTAAAVGLFFFSLFTSRQATLATLSAALATGADLVSYLPTFQKARTKPLEDSPVNFAFNSVKCIPALLALDVYTAATMMYLLMLLVVNGSFAIYLFAMQRRFQPS